MCLFVMKIWSRFFKYFFSFFLIFSSFIFPFSFFLHYSLFSFSFLSLVCIMFFLIAFFSKNKLLNIRDPYICYMVLHNNNVFRRWFSTLGQKSPWHSDSTGTIADLGFKEFFIKLEWGVIWFSSVSFTLQHFHKWVECR